METIIEGHRYFLDTPIGTGGEGEIYELDQKLVAKIYHRDIINEDRRLKVLALCDLFSNNIQRFGTESFAFPEKPAFENRNAIFDFISGFSMKYFKGCPTLGDICFDLDMNDFKKYNNHKMDDPKAVELLYNIFDLVDRLHTSRIIVGDINPGNILYNTNLNLPVFIDMDASQLGKFRCEAYSNEYIDPLIQEQGKNSQGSYTYNFESDAFSIACVCYEFFVGANPFYVRTKPPKTIMYKKEKGISIMKFCHSSVLDLNGVQYLKHEENSKIEARLNVLKTKFPKLFDFFISIFVDNNRTTLLQTLDRSDPRHPAYIFYSQSGFDKVKKEIISDRTRLRQPIKSDSSQQKNIKKSTLPNSGFSKIVNPVKHLKAILSHHIAAKDDKDQSGFDKIKKEIISDRTRLRQPIKSDQTYDSHIVAAKKDKDPKEFAIFLSNYGSDILKIVEQN
jgi:serine/threonine protein kinase